MSKKRAPGEYWGQHPVKNDMQPKKKDEGDRDSGTFIGYVA